MCLTIPGKIVEIEKDIATIDYGSEKTKAKIIQGNYKTGDYVLIKAKIIIEKVPEEQMREWEGLLKELKND